MQPLSVSSTQGPSTPADVHQLGPRSRTTARCAATLTKKALAGEHQSERQHREGYEDKHNLPLEFTRRPRRTNESLKRKPTCPSARVRDARGLECAMTPPGAI